MTMIFEILMMLCFGAAWPFSIVKSYKTRSTSGKSIFFLTALLVGYIFGIINKFINQVDYVMFFYMLNMLMVGADICLYLRNRKIEKENNTVTIDTDTIYR